MHRWCAAALVLLAVGQAGCGGLPPQPPGFDAEVALPEPEDLNPDPAVLEVTLVARPADFELVPGKTTTLWTYNGKLPGPLLRARRGDRLVVHFKNELPEPTTIHWHGVRVPAAMDGSEATQAAVPPGGTFEYAFDLLDAGTFWYHPHVRSSPQVGYGLYGALVVEAPEDPPLGDPLVLVLSDIGVDDQGVLEAGDSNGWFGDYFGREGNRLLVNGRQRPRVLGRVGLPQRWRVVNAARARYFKVEVPGAVVTRVGGDGGLIAHPLRVETVTLAPGERAELTVLPKAAGESVVMAHDANRFNLASPGPSSELFVFDVTAKDAARGAPRPPESLREIAPLDLLGAPLQRLELMEKSNGTTTVLAINGQTASEATPLHATAGVNEIWEVTNSTAYDHPFHLHGFFFQVLSVDGVAPAVAEWKDTVNIDPEAVVRLGVWFDHRPGMWMFHCHILDHADLGMMGMLMLME
jgi:FtsP/CotA-like multicopper oxidase with cupredoxin domain